MAEVSEEWRVCYKVHSCRKRLLSLNLHPAATYFLTLRSLKIWRRLGRGGVTLAGVTLTLTLSHGAGVQGVSLYSRQPASFHQITTSIISHCVTKDGSVYIVHTDYLCSISALLPTHDSSN